ncbi:MAG: hypothetical protein DWP97_11685 [Calditrichaeota bacterium]|nr:MAG: hypothetical protein DWP97_11685 [Calditrichota bacterium]
MKIGNNPNPVKLPEVEQEKKNQVVQQTSRNSAVEDYVTISNEGRNKLKEIADSSKGQSVDTDKKISLKLMKIRNKIEAGFYETDKVIEEITEKLSNTIREEIIDIKAE